MPNQVTATAPIHWHNTAALEAISAWLSPANAQYSLLEYILNAQGAERFHRVAQELGEVLQRLITRLGLTLTEYTGSSPRRTFL